MRTSASPTSNVTLNVDPLIEDSSLTRSGLNDGFLWERLVPVDNVNDGYDFAYDFTGQTLYWLEHNHSSFDSHAVNVKRVQFDGEQRQSLTSSSSSSGDEDDNLEEQSLSEPYCLEFDYASRNLILGSTSESDLSALNVDNLQRTVIFAGSNVETGVGAPTMLAINYVDSEIYWIDQVD